MKKLLILAIILIPIILILGSARLVVFDMPLHEELLSKSNVPFQNYTEINKAVFDYLQGYKDTVETSVFTDKEKDHLRDVKTLINVLSIVLYLSIIGLIVIFYYNRHSISKILFYGGLITLGILLLMFLVSYFSFDFAFATFHKIFFPQGNYIFRTNLPQLYNYAYYTMISFRIFLMSLIAAILLVVQKMIIIKLRE
jgi:hypothetical protein